MKKKSTFAKNALFEGANPTPVNNYTPTPTHEYTDTHTPTPISKERKTKRLQLLLRESTVERLGAYAKEHDTSRNEIVQTLVDDFLRKEGW